MQQRLTPGVRVMTTSGLYATVRDVTDARIVLETSPGVHSTWARNAIARIEAEAPDAPAPDQTVDLTDATRETAAARETATTDAGAEAGSEPGVDGRRMDRPGS